jgi:hypothetical protein
VCVCVRKKMKVRTNILHAELILNCTETPRIVDVLEVPLSAQISVFYVVFVCMFVCLFVCLFFSFFDVLYVVIKRSMSKSKTGSLT